MGERFSAIQSAAGSGRRSPSAMVSGAGSGCPAPGHAASPDSPADDAERADLRDQLTEAMSGLTQGQREVLLMHDLEGWKHREIGDVLGMPEGTVRYHLFNARRAVRGRLRALVGEED